MAAQIVTPSTADWPTILRFLDASGEGALVIPPDIQTELAERGRDPTDLVDLDYDFGGDPDIWIDVLRSLDPHEEGSYAAEEIIAALQPPPPRK